MVKLRSMTTVACALGLNVAACGGTVGARYTIDGTATFSQGDAPADDMTLRMASVWSKNSNMPALGLDGSIVLMVSSPIGPWAPTAQPNSYTFNLVVEVGAPENGNEPIRADMSAQVQGQPGTISAAQPTHDVGDEEEGWIPVHVVATFDTSRWN